ncbi:hypothetical protein [Vulcanococcus limneticus]|uniref:hypothetical protein n=1 Tax=Vulcanococcus limneticus TaxID=2170428 RepID=UPI00398C1016
MVDVGCLAAFDHLQWLRTGASAAESLNCNQLTVSRHVKKSQQVFGVTLKRKAAEWHLDGDTTLLCAERHVHQRYRWDFDRTLRIDAQHWLRDSYSSLKIDGWQQGNMNYLEYERPVYLLQNRIIDAWLCSSPDHPTDPSLTTIQLCSMPSYLVVKDSHPLAALGSSATLADVRPYPIQPLPKDSFPVFQAVLESLGLNATLDDRLPASPLPIEDLIVGIASPLTIGLYGPGHIVLPCELPILVGDALVVRSEYSEHPRLRKLVCDLLGHIRSVAAGLPAVTILDGAALPLNAKFKSLVS